MSEVIVVNIIPTYNHKFWYDMTTFVCSSKEMVIKCIIKYIKDFYNADVTVDHENKALSKDLHDIHGITNIFYSYADYESGWRILIKECEIDR